MAGVAAAILTAGLVSLPAAPAEATHPCGMNPDGTTFDPDPTADHAACAGPRPAPRPGDVQLGDADSGRTVTVTTGTRVYVDIHPPSGQIWGDVAGGPALHRMYVDVQSGISSGVFTAMAPTDGQQISAQADSACAHSETPCPRAFFLWSATVVVQSAPASPAPSPTSQGEACAPRRAPTPNGFTLLTESSNGSTLRVPRGQPVLVNFTGCNGGFDLPPPDPSDLLYRYRVNASNPGGATAVFATSRLGTVTLTSTTDGPCFHAEPRCLAPQQTWSATVQVVEPCELLGPAAAASGAVVELSGRVIPGAAVQVWFRERGGSEFVPRRQLTADSSGVVRTSYVANDDYRWYATSGDCTTPPGLTRVTPWLAGPRFAGRGSVVPVTAHGPAGASVALYFRPPGGQFRLGRTGRLDSTGTFRTSYVATTDQRYYAVTGPDRRTSPALLTQIQ